MKKAKAPKDNEAPAEQRERAKPQRHPITAAAADLAAAMKEAERLRAREASTRQLLMEIQGDLVTAEREAAEAQARLAKLAPGTAVAP